MSTAPSSAKNIKKLCKDKLRQAEKMHAVTLSFGGMGLTCADPFPKYKFASTLTRVDLTGNRLHSLPSKFSRLANLQELYLSHNLLVDIPPVIFTLTNLETLNLERNQLQFIPTEIERLRKLTTLALAHNRLRTLPNELSKLLRLKKLTLTGNQVPEYYEKIISLLRTGFDNINLSNMRISRLPSLTVEMAGQLRILNLAHNHLEVFPQEVFFLTQLRVLEMRHNRLQELPDGIGRLTFLEVLGLAQNSISALPDVMSGLSALCSLNLTHNRFKGLPASLFSCASLSELYFGHNAHVDCIPEAISNLTCLQILALPGNKLRELPTALLLSMPSLRSVNLSHNPIYSLPMQDEFLAAYAPPCGRRPADQEGVKKRAELNLQQTLLSPVLLHLVHVRNHSILDLSDLDLDVLPPELDRYAHLVERFTLAGNSFASFPLDLQCFSSLQRLDVSNNALESIPDNMGECVPHMLHVDFSFNAFQALPVVLSSLRDLQFLSFSGNQIERVPAWMSEMTSLRTLRLGSNALTEFPCSLPTTLVELDLSKNQIPHLPTDLLIEFRSLVTLNVDGNFLTVVPSLLQQLTTLHTLNVSRNQVTELPLSFIQWCQEGSRIVLASGNPFESRSVGRVYEFLESLTLPAVMNSFNEEVPRMLDLSHCRLEQAPPEIEYLQHLLSLSLAHNHFQTLDSLPYHQLRELTIFNADLNELIDLPPSFSELQALTHVSLAHNRLSQLPPALLQLSALLVLNVAHNALESLPDGLQELQTLQELNVASNQFRFFPECLYKLPRLQVIHIENNQIRTIGLRVDMAWNLMRHLYLWGNTVDVEVLRRKFPQLNIVCEEPLVRSNRCSSDGLVLQSSAVEQDAVYPSLLGGDTASVPVAASLDAPRGRSRKAFREYRDIPMMKSGSVPSMDRIQKNSSASLPSQV